MDSYCATKMLSPRAAAFGVEALLKSEPARKDYSLKSPIFVNRNENVEPINKYSAHIVFQTKLDDINIHTNEVPSSPTVVDLEYNNNYEENEEEDTKFISNPRKRTLSKSYLEPDCSICLENALHPDLTYSKIQKRTKLSDCSSKDTEQTALLADANKAKAFLQPCVNGNKSPNKLSVSLLEEKTPCKENKQREIPCAESCLATVCTLNNKFITPEKRDNWNTHNLPFLKPNLLEEHSPREETELDGPQGPLSRTTSEHVVDQRVRVALQHRSLWSEFHQHQTEMIITKNGRRMFPVIKIRVQGLDPDKLYMIYMDIKAVDGKRYRYSYPSSTWTVAGTGATSSADPVYIHPESPATGRRWMEMLIISFDKLKLTNNKSRETKGQIFLHSMQKYLPRIWIQSLESKEVESELNLYSEIDRARSRCFSFPETSFITVTAYQNQKITRLKINTNPFAKGFRDNSKYKETLERHTMTSSHCGIDCQHSQHFPFNNLPSFPVPFFPPSLSFSPILPFPSSCHLSPAVSPNRWSSFIPSVKPSNEIMPSSNSFFNRPLYQWEGNHYIIDLRMKRENT